MPVRPSVSRWSRPLGMVVLEAFLVALGVALALAAGEWRDGVHARERARHALASIDQEIRFNRALVDSSLAYHASRADTLRACLREGRTASARSFDRGFIHAAPLEDTAWRTALSTGALDPVPYETVLEISRLYAAQEAYRQQSDITGEIVYRALFQEGPEGILERPRNHLSLLYTFLYRERELRGRYEAALAGDDQKPMEKPTTPVNRR